MKASEIETTVLAHADAGHHALLVPATAQRRELDLGRDVHALLGLVFDRIDLAGAAAQIRRRIASGRRCYMSTPNVNFVAAALQDSQFRDSVHRSDLSVADGFPIVRLSRWLGIDLPGRVAGADLFEHLQSSPRSAQQPPIKLFLLGGPPGIAAQAAARLNAQAQGFECVGHDEGGFGEVEEMSSQALIDRINASGAEFILIALGAKKGQGWGDRNRDRLRAPVLSHLGAVINFAAQSIERAPRWMQRLGLEWAWRIHQEPHLWRRYWNDGRLLAKTFLTQLLPWSLRRLLGRMAPGTGQPARFDIARDGDASALVALSGDWRAGADQTALRESLAALLREGRRVEFDLRAAPALGSALLGVITLIDGWQITPRALRAGTAVHPALRAELRAHGAQHLLG